MKLPKNQESRKRILRALVSLSKLPPAKRREIVEAEKAKRASVQACKRASVQAESSRTSSAAGADCGGPDKT